MARQAQTDAAGVAITAAIRTSTDTLPTNCEIGGLSFETLTMTLCIRSKCCKSCAKRMISKLAL
jgi:hypothetical protein